MKKEEKANYDPRMISAKKTPEKSRYPIHNLVWHNKHRQLEKELATNEQVRQRRAIKHISAYRYGLVSLLEPYGRLGSWMGGGIDVIHVAPHLRPWSIIGNSAVNCSL